MCEGTECGATLGATCQYNPNHYPPYYVEIKLIEEGVTCPVGTLPSCVVEVITVDGYSVPDASNHCSVDGTQSCDKGCGVGITCDSAVYCNTYSNIVATVSCSGFSEPISCTTE